MVWDVLKMALPSVVTMLALSFGLSAVKTANEGSFDVAVLLMAISALCDAADGHVARYLDAVTSFGGELDSLCDLVDFGVAPALIMYQWIISRTDSTWMTDNMVWVCCCFFVAACSYRLARFNVGSLRHPRPLPDRTFPAQRPDASAAAVIAGHTDGFTRHYVARSKFFQGVPAPAGGYLALLPVILEFNGQRMPDMQQYLGPLFDGRVTASAVMIIVAMLMVSALPMLSGKVFMRNPVKESHLRSRSLGTQIFKASFVVACIAMLVNNWHLSLLLIECFVIASLPLSPVIYLFFAVDA